MLHHHSILHLYEQPVFSILDFETPMNERLPIPATACFCYLLEGDEQDIEPTAGIRASKGSVILSLCGMTLGSMLSNQKPGNIKSLIVHFFPEHLKLAFTDTKPPHWKELESPVSKYVVQMATNNLIENFIISVQALFENKIAVSNELLILKLKELIMLLLQTKSSPDILKMVRSLFSEREFSFKEMIDAHLFEPLSVEDLSGLMNMSLSTFKRTFKKIYGETPGAYIIDKRIEAVAKQLLLSDAPINQIGYEAGFSNPAHLSRCFKNKYGYSPSQYRLNFLDKKKDF